MPYTDQARRMAQGIRNPEADLYIVLAWRDGGAGQPAAEPFVSEREARDWCERDGAYDRYQIQKHTVVFQDEDGLLSLAQVEEFTQSEDGGKVWVEWYPFGDLSAYEDRDKVRRYLREYLHMYNIKWRCWRKKPSEETSKAARWRWEG